MYSSDARTRRKRRRRVQGRIILKTHLVGGVAQFNAAAFKSVSAARGYR